MKNPGYPALRMHAYSLVPVRPAYKLAAVNRIWIHPTQEHLPAVDGSIGGTVDAVAIHPPVAPGSCLSETFASCPKMPFPNTGLS